MVRAAIRRGEANGVGGDMKQHIMTLAFVVASSIAVPAFAQTAPSAPAPTPEAMNRLYNCTAISEDAARLACFDEATARLRNAQAEGSLVAVDQGQLETLRRESFGFSLPSIANLLPSRSEDVQEEVSVEVANVIRRGDGHSIFVMSDGQRWVLLESSAARNVRAGDTVRIRRAALGSFLLISSRGGAALRVRRES